MTILYITEFADFGTTKNGRTGQVAEQPPLAEQTIALTSSSAQSSAFNTNTSLIRLHTDSICAVEFGTDPTAVASGGGSPTARMAANQTEYYTVPNGGTYMVAGITSS